MPSLLHELHELVPCDSAGFFWVDTAGEMSNLYAEILLPPELMRLYFSRFYEDRERGFRKGFTRLAARGAIVSSASFDADFYRSEYYNLILRHLDAHHMLYAVIREGASPLGQLSLYRPRDSAAFSAADQDCLAGVTERQRFPAEQVECIRCPMPISPAGQPRYSITFTDYPGCGWPPAWTNAR